MCTMRNFPNQIEHCIEWGRDKFNTLFVDRANNAIGYLDNPQSFLDDLKKNTTSTGAKDTLVGVKDLLDMKKKADFAQCMQVARTVFEGFYEHDIKNLLGIFPEDHIND